MLSPYKFGQLLEKFRDDPVKAREFSDATSDDDFHDMLACAAVEGILRHRFFLPANFAGIPENGRMRWPFKTNRGWYEIKIEKLENSSDDHLEASHAEIR